MLSNIEIHSDTAPPRAAPPTVQEHWTVVDTLLCLNCPYDLRTLVGPAITCPECGHVNNLQDPIPFARREIPEGERDRAHWPGKAVGLSFLIPFFALLTFAFSRQSLTHTGTVVSAGLLLLCFVGWVLGIRKWLRSCSRTRDGLLILLLLHLGGWGLMMGLGVGVGFVIPDSAVADRGVDGVIGAILLWGIASPLLYGGGALLIRRGRRTGLYRRSLDDYRLPIAMNIATPTAGRERNTSRRREEILDRSGTLG